MTVKNHLKRYPGCRASTLENIHRRDEMTARLRKELSMDEVTDKRAKFIAECEPKETVLRRLIRKLRRV